MCRPESPRVRIHPTRAGSLPPPPAVTSTLDSAPDPDPIPSVTIPPQSAPPRTATPPPDAATAATASSSIPRRSRSQTRRSRSTRSPNLPETDAPPPSRSRKSSGPTPGPSSAPAESSSVPQAQGRRTHASPSRQRRKSTHSKPLPNVPQVPISSGPSTAPVRTSTSAEDVHHNPPPVPPKRSATPPPQPRLSRTALGKRPLRDPTPTTSKSAPSASAPTATAAKPQPLPLPHNPPDPALVQRILSTAPARGRRPVPITILPRVQSVPIHDGPPSESTAPESSDDWSRALD